MKREPKLGNKEHWVKIGLFLSSTGLILSKQPKALVTDILSTQVRLGTL